MDLEDHAPPAQPVQYASFTRRLRALLIDTAIVCGAIAVVFIAADVAREVPGSGRVAWLALVVLVLLYEPMLVWRFGATIGHRLTDLVVVCDRTGGRPSLATAMLRYVIKVPFGILSFITIGLTRRRQAIHDALSATTVRLSEAATPMAGDDDVHASVVELPSRVQRIVVIALYLALGFVLVSIVTALALGECVQDAGCGEDARVFTDIVSLAWFAASGMAIIAGWRGRLPGARGRTID